MTERLFILLERFPIPDQNGGKGMKAGEIGVKTVLKAWMDLS